LFFLVAALFEAGAWMAPLWIAASAATAGVAAAIFDVLEDRAILRTLDAESIGAAQVQTTRRYSLCKWALLALAQLLLGLGARQPAAALLIASSLVGLTGLKWPKLLAISMAAFAVVVLAAFVTAIIQ
jgi:hypothetical protein